MPGSLAKSRAARSVERPRTRNSRDWTSRPSAQRLLQLVDVILPERVLGERREASRSGGRAGGGQRECANRGAEEVWSRSGGGTCLARCSNTGLLRGASA